MLEAGSGPQSICGRFAPSTTGSVHPGTLLAGLLCWLDARASEGHVILRLEDLDQERTKPGFVREMQRDFEWFGLDWDRVALQSESQEAHDATFESLVAQGRVYACSCTRSQIRALARRAPDGAYHYVGTCRSQVVSASSWRETAGAFRLRLEEGEMELRDESGLDLAGSAAELFGDPILRRRDGTYAYHFASVIDDGQSGVNRVVRGRDLAPSTILQVAIQRVLGLPAPSYRHHLLFLERSGEKLSKLHGAVDLKALRPSVDAADLCGLIASFVGLAPTGTRCHPSDLIPGFRWDRVSVKDVELDWDPKSGLRKQS